MGAIADSPSTGVMFDVAPSLNLQEDSAEGPVVFRANQFALTPCDSVYTVDLSSSVRQLGSEVVHRRLPVPEDVEFGCMPRLGVDDMREVTMSPRSP